MRRKAGIFAVAVFAATALLAALAGTAAAGGIASSYFTDPQNTNVPYLAWDGEQIRLVKCFTAAELPVVGVGRFVIEDWSGNPFFKPQFENSGVNGTDGTAVEFAGAGDQAGNFCYATDIVSLKPGLAVVKLVVENAATPNQGVPLAKHQFLAVWMDLGDMNTFELNTPIAGDFSSTGTATNLFDPLVSTANGYVDVRIKGTFPLGNNFAGMAPSDTVTLPDDWVWLAEHFAVEQASTSARPGQAAYRWDIHDSLSWDPSQALDGAANHSTLSGCPGLNPTFLHPNTLSPLRFDTVDNCLGGNEFASFSNIWGDSIPPTIGPFDQERPGQTLLSDGLLNTGDAPMPAARIDVSLTGSAGALVSADKHVIYSRNLTGTASAAFPNNAHNLFAPFYATYLPATSAPPTASGIDGPAGGNDFAGFLNNATCAPATASVDCYHYWDTVGLSARGGLNNCLDANGMQIPTPTGWDHVVVYTDEHGEAIVGYNPWAGFVLNADANHRCFEITQPTLFGSTVNVEANYPYQQPFNAPRPAADTITKAVQAQASKTLSCVPKGTNEMFCVETILDFFGNPVLGADVHFSRSPLGKIEPDSVAFGGFNTIGQVLHGCDVQGCLLTTNSHGQAGVVVTESLTPPNPNSCVDVTAQNMETAFQGGTPIKTFRMVTPSTGAQGCAGISGATGGTTTTGGSTTTTGGSSTTTTTGGSTTAGVAGASGNTGSNTAVSNTSVVTLGASTTPSQVTVTAPAAPAQAAAATKTTKVSAGTLAYVRVIWKQQVGRMLVVRVNGKAKTARLAITLKGANGQALQKAVRFVPTNTAATVKNLRLSTKVRTVSVSVG